MSVPTTETVSTQAHPTVSTAPYPGQSRPTSDDATIFPLGDLYSDEPPLETDLHRDQIDLLIRLLKWLWRERQDFYASGNLTVYYSPKQLKSEDFREKHSEPLLQTKSKEAVQSIFGPDFFVVLDTEQRPRKSWTVWEEGGKYPNLIVELLSESTAKTDRGLKKQIYQDIFRTLDYFWFDPHTLEFEGFHLMDGRYQPIPTTEQGWRWSEQLGLYLGVHETQLRFFTPEGELVSSPEEEAEAERKRADVQQQQNEALRAKLQALGVDPDTV